jgi:hypothetical protein
MITLLLEVAGADLQGVGEVEGVELGAAVAVGGGEAVVGAVAGAEGVVAAAAAAAAAVAVAAAVAAAVVEIIRVAGRGMRHRRLLSVPPLLLLMALL